MKKIALAAAFTVAASTAYAGSMSDPIVEPMIEMIEEGSSSSSGGGVWVPLLILAVIAAAVI